MADNNAYIKTIKENELINGTDDTDVYPITSTQAIFSQTSEGGVPEGVKPKLEDRLKDHEDDAKDLHEQTEKFVITLTNTLSPVVTLFEITGNDNVVTMASTAKVETFGDQPAKNVTPASDAITVSAGTVERTNYTYTWTLDNSVGSKTATYSASYGAMVDYELPAKTATVTVNANLRKFFGYIADGTTISTPEDLITTDVAHNTEFSNSVSCTITVPASYNSSTDASKFKRVCIAVPNGMTINRVVQPDALNAPLPVTLVGTINRTITGIADSFAYKLYKSDDLIDSSVNKRLTIS